MIVSKRRRRDVCRQQRSRNRHARSWKTHTRNTRRESRACRSSGGGTKSWWPSRRPTARIAQRDFEERLQEREAAHADELAQARAATHAAGARAEQLAADVASLHEQLSALNDRLDAETQGRLQAARVGTGTRGVGRHSYATRGANREPAGRVAAARRAGGRAARSRLRNAISRSGCKSARRRMPTSWRRHAPQRTRPEPARNNSRRMWPRFTSSCQQ